MFTNKMSLELPRSVENFARGLLATTCLTAACGSSALASTVTLTFGNQATEPGTLLPVGTTVVNGFVGALPNEAGTSNTDWFEFQGLTPGDTYTLTGVYNPLGGRGESGNGETGIRLAVFTDSQTPLFTNQYLEGSGVSGVSALVGTVPGDGFLDVEVVGNPFYRESPAGSSYQVTLSQAAERGSTVPEPASLSTAGLALAGALAWKRKRQR